MGISNATAAAQLRSRRARDHQIPDHVTVYVHNKTSKNTDELELLYTVHVAGKPVLAVTAAEDMKLVSNTEATAELGFPVVTKAERELSRILLWQFVSESLSLIGFYSILSPHTTISLPFFYLNISLRMGLQCKKVVSKTNVLIIFVFKINFFY